MTPKVGNPVFDGPECVEPVEDERTGQMRTKVIEAPRFAIIVDGVEDAATANARISALAKESAAKVDSLTTENEKLKARIAELEAVDAVSKK